MNKIDRNYVKLKEKDFVFSADGDRLVDGQIVKFGKERSQVAYRSFGDTKKKWKYNHSIVKCKNQKQNSIESSPLSKLYYNQLKASGVADSDMIDKMKARGY